MIRSLLIVLLIALCVVACDRSTHDAASSPPPATTSSVDEELPPPPPEPKLVVDRLLMWEVAPSSSPAAKSYIVGTYHIGTDFHGLEELPPAGQTAFEGSRRIVLEADLGLVDPELEKLMILPGPKTLDTMLTPEQWDAALEHTGLPPQQLKFLRPHTVAAELSRKWTPDAGVRGMDGRFRILAKAYDKELAFLETPREQLEMLSKVMTAEILGRTLDDADAEKARSAQLLASFRAGDEAKLTAQLFPEDQVAEYNDFYAAVFWKRNAAWVERLSPWLDEGGAFIAVGAGHLLGNDNLRSLLTNAGYSVSEVER